MIEFSPHAEAQMKRRGISREDVTEVLREYESSYPSRNKARTCFVKHVDDRRIEVVAVVTETKTIVVTTFDQLDES